MVLEGLSKCAAFQSRIDERHLFEYKQMLDI
jgi:hypothetical protein